MHEITARIIKGLKYIHAPEKTISFKRRNNAGPQLIKVEYFVDLVARGIIPDNTILFNVRRHYNLAEAFIEHTYHVESKDEAMTILLEFCESNLLPLHEEDKNRLQQERDNGKVFC